MINWKYIKGLNQDNNNNNSLYTFLDFEYKKNFSLTSKELLPHIRLNTSNDFASATDLGTVITSDAEGQEITKRFDFKNTVVFGTTSETISANNFYCYYPAHFNSAIESAGGLTCNGTADFYQNVVFHAGTTWNDVTITGGFQLKDNWLNLSGTMATINFNPDNNAVNGSILFKNTQIAYFTKDADFHINHMCEAQYFNATSDRRAKEDLKILNFKALDLINHTNLYSFIYKDTKTPSIGIIAQDVQDINIEGFKLVDNEDATGQDMDYMSIHESKLVYILWQAIKEQQKEIEELKKRLN